MRRPGGALLLTEIADRDQNLMVFSGIERARFRRPVVPGDQLRIEVTVLAWRRNAVRMEGQDFCRRQARVRSHRELPPGAARGELTHDMQAAKKDE